MDVFQIFDKYGFPMLALALILAAAWQLWKFAKPYLARGLDAGIEYVNQQTAKTAENTQLFTKQTETQAEMVATLAVLKEQVGKQGESAALHSHVSKRAFCETLDNIGPLVVPAHHVEEYKREAEKIKRLFD